LTPKTLIPENSPSVPQVGCAGILVVDTICGPVKALPEPGQLTILDEIPSTVGGCAANVACTLAKQGVSVGVAGLVGEDSSAEFLIGKLAARHVECTQLKSTADYPTSQTIILLVEGQDRRFLHSFGTNRFFSVLQLDREWIRNLKVFYVGGLFAMPNFHTDELAELLKYCRAHNVVTVVDVVASQDIRDFGQLDACLPHIDYFLPNNDEAARITGRSDPLEQARIFRDKGVATTIVTLGEKGALAIRGDDLWRVGTFPVEFVDMTGCGDAFDAGLISGVLKNWDLPRMLGYATALGGSCAQALGAYDGVFTADEAENFLQTKQIDVEHMTIS
jgi:sugar/nucleoside kinase (ribokinase family)